MRLFRHWKMMLGLAAIFAAGMGTGAVGGVVLLFHFFTRPESVQHWVDSRMKELDHRLKLTPEQKEKIRPIAQNAGDKFRAIGADAFTKILQTAQETRGEISKELTPAQQKEFDKMRQQVIDRLRDLAQKEIVILDRKRDRKSPDPTPVNLAPEPETAAPQK